MSDELENQSDKERAQKSLLTGGERVSKGRQRQKSRE